MVLPDRGWPSYEEAFRRLGEKRSDAKDERLLRVLRDLELVTSDLGSMTEAGNDYFHARFIRDDVEEAKHILHLALLDYSPAAAVAQFLAGVPTANRSKAESVLRSQGFGHGLSERSLGSLLTLMNTADVIAYSPTSGEIEVLDSAAKAVAVPASVFVAPETPYGNKVWLRRVLEECTGHIYWLDKHFLPVAFDAIWEAADGGRLSEVRILSLRLPDHEGRRPIRHYRDLVRELSGRGVSLEWRTIESTKIKSTHDRWIISRTTARNVPNVNAIYTGQHSELNRSEQHETLETIFDGYWQQGVPFDSAQSIQGDPDA